MEWPQIQTTITDGNAISTVVDAPWVSVTSLNGMTGDVIVEPVIKPFQSNHYYLKDSVIAHNECICFAKRTFTSGGSFNANDWDVIDFAQEQADWNENDSTAESYIKNKPTIPTVNNGRLTIQKNGTQVTTFDANQAGNTTANIVTDELKRKSDTRSSMRPSDANIAGSATLHFTTIGALDSQTQSGGYADALMLNSWDNNSGGRVNALVASKQNDQKLYHYTGTYNGSSWSGKKEIAYTDAIPTKVSDLTNDSSFVTSSGTVAKANQLTTPRTIAISGGATGTATSFSGASNISIPITGMYETYLNWGNQNLSGRVSPIDTAMSEEFSANRLAYMDASKITVEYSRDGGSTWVDYGLTAAQKTGLVTTSQAIYTGGTNSNAASNYKVRVNLNPTNPYMATRKLFIYISTGGVSNAQVLVERKSMGGTNYETVTTATISGWSGWNSIPINITFGGTASWSNSDLRLTFSYNGKSTSYPNAQLQISKIRLYGETAWSAPSNLATNGHLYTYDTSQNATFPANVKVTGSLQHGNYTYTLPNKNGTVAMTSDIPSVLTINDGTLTIQKNATTIDTFTANSATNKTVNIVVPTDTGDLTNNAGYLKASDIYPVGSIVTFYDTVDHSSFLGLTWTRFAAGKMVVGYDSSDTDFDTIGNTGGVKTVTLTVDQIPSHRHSATSAGSRGKSQADTSGSSGYAWNSDGGYTGYSGGGKAHNNMPPYITAALWRRIA